METWKDITGYEGRYQISNLGRVKSLTSGIVKKCRLGRGYLYTSFWIKGVSKTLKPHRLVAIHFIPNPENKPCINHINGIKTDNRIENLEWCTHKENVTHAIDTGLRTSEHYQGSKNGMSKLHLHTVLKIRALYNYYSQFELGKMFNVSRSNIGLIVTNKTWNFI